jgi:hypothetical protein
MGILIFFIPFAAPLIVGLRLLGADTIGMSDSLNRFRQFAAVLTLKPLLATPLWFLLGFVAYQQGLFWLPLLPGIGLTLLIVRDEHPVLREQYANHAWGLLGWDLLRWGTSALFTLTLAMSVRDREAGVSSDVRGIGGLLGLVALALPSVFALVAHLKWNKLQGSP